MDALERKIQIYTGSGDRGKTSLFSGERVNKYIYRVEAYGDVDELNSILGVLRAMIPEGDSDLAKDLDRIQSNLFHVGAWLATSADSPLQSSLRRVTQEDTKVLEAAIDRMEAKLDRISGFIIPGGHSSAAWAHVARTVCRRAERHVVLLSSEYDEEKGREELRKVLAYLNRLSDYLFVLARFCNQLAGVPEKFWEK